MGEVMHGDGFGGGVQQQRVQAGGYPPQAPAGHVAMAGPRNQGLQLLLFLAMRHCQSFQHIAFGIFIIVSISSDPV